MIKKEIEELIPRKKTIYVSEDGVEFNNLYECEKHEFELKKHSWSDFSEEHISYIKMCDPESDVLDVREIECCYIDSISSFEEFKYWLYNHFHYDKYVVLSSKYSECYLNHWITYEYDDHGDYEHIYFYTLEEELEEEKIKCENLQKSIENLEKLIKKRGKDDV